MLIDLSIAVFCFGLGFLLHGLVIRWENNNFPYRRRDADQWTPLNKRVHRLYEHKN